MVILDDNSVVQLHDNLHAKEVSTKDKRFANREAQVISTGRIDGDRHINLTKIAVPDRNVVCNGCNDNIYPSKGYLIYLGKRELKEDAPYDFYCGKCLKNYFPKAEIVK